MHLSSLQNMARFREKYLSDCAGTTLTILDLGSTEMGACYRPIFENPSWKYIGADLESGPNVNLVLSHPYHWKEVRSGSVDVLVSGQVLEHVEFFWITMLEISRVLKPGGLACIVVPSGGEEHRYPLDCWRFYPDGMNALAGFARLHVLEVYTQWEGIGDHGSDQWADSVLVARKPTRPLVKAIGVRLLQSMQRRLNLFSLIRRGA